MPSRPYRPVLRVFLVIAALAMASVLTPAVVTHAATTYNVNSTSDTDTSATQTACSNGGSGCTLRSAITDANTLAASASATINVPAGTYNITAGELDLFSASRQVFTITGAGAASTIINGDGKHLIFAVNISQVSGGDLQFPQLSLSGLTVQNGKDDTADFGGGTNAGLGGGALIAGGYGEKVTITNCVFQNDSANDGAGGAIQWLAIGDPAGGGTLSISNSTFANNTINAPAPNNSGSFGGAIDFNGGDSLSITGSTFTNNTAGNSSPGEGGAIATGSSSPTIHNPAFTITNSTFTGNTANGTATPSNPVVGGAIYNHGGTMVLQYNRIVNNTPSLSASGGEVYQQANVTPPGAITGTENWWGVNTNPSAFVSQSSGATAPNVNPWIVLKTTASPNPINEFGSTTLTTSFLQDSNGGALTTSNISTLIGLPVTWTNAIHGTLSNTQSPIQSSGKATATFTQDGTCNTSSGEAEVDHVPNGDSTATGTVTVNCPDLTATKSDSVSNTTTFGNNWTWKVHVANGGAGPAFFSNGNTVLTDNLPSSSMSYGTASVSNTTGVATGSVSCSISGTTLTCSASGAVQFNNGGSFDVTFTANPSATGTFVNPVSGGTCTVDPGNVISESNESNNSCSDTVGVNKASTTTTLASSLNPSVFGQSVTFTATIGGPANAIAIANPTGSVDFFDGGAKIGSGTLSTSGGVTTATVGTSSLVGGSHTITATYNGDGNYASSSANGANAVTQTVNQASTTTTLASSTNPSVSGQSVTFTATISGPANAIAVANPTGSVDFFDGGTKIGSGNASSSGGVTTATFSTSSLAAGQHTITATYNGDGNYSGSSATGANGVTQTVNQAPSITSANATTFTVGSSGSFTVTTGAAYPTPPTLSDGGASLPNGVSFKDNGDGTATLSGTPAAGTGGSYTFTITASNGISPDATQTFTLTVNEAASITSGNATTFTVGTSGTFRVTTSGSPNPSLSDGGASLPAGVTFVDNNDGTATLSGTPAAGTGGTYSFTITAHNGVGSDATQSFTLTVNEAASVTSANATTFKVGTSGSFTVTTFGYPHPSLSESGALPGSVTFKDNGDGTATLSGTPAAGTGGQYTVTITAHNGIGSDSTQSFTLTVDEAPTITSSTAYTFVVGHTSTFTVTTSHSYPTPTLSESGALPGGVTFTDNHDGTATLSGTPAAGSQGSYPLTITADNGVSPAASQGTSPSAPASASQSFTLTVSGPTIAVVKSFTAKRSGSRVAFRWHLVQKATIAGFNLYAGKHKLNKTLIKVHSKMTYNYHVTWTKHSHFVLDVLLTDGAHLSIPSQ